MRTFSTDENNDLIFKGGALEVLSDLEATMKVCEHYALALKGEMTTKKNKGMPYFQSVFGREPDLQLFEAWFKIRMGEIKEVVAVRAFDAQIRGDALQYSATIETIFGTGHLDG